MKSTFEEHKKLIGLLLIGFLFHSILAVIPPLNGDEATFWEWSRHLAFGYYAHPPMTSWLVALFIKIFGIYKYNVRLAAIVLHLGTCIFVYFLSLEIIRKKEAALIAVTIYLLMPLSIVLGTAMTTDAGLVFCFTAATYFIKKAIIDERKYHWYSTAIACGGMLLTKFMAVLFPPGVFFFLLFNGKYRKQFMAKEPYIATLIALVIFSPFLHWNMKNQWLTFQFNFIVRQQDEGGFELMKPPIYLAGQMLAASPVVFIVMLIALVTFVIRFTRNRNAKGLVSSNGDPLLLLSYVVIFPLLYFFVISLFFKVGAHWVGVIYPISSVIISAWFYLEGKNTFSGTVRRGKILWTCLISSVIVSGLICVLIVYPRILPDNMIYTNKVYDDAPIASHYFGWKEIGIHIDEIKKEWEDRPEGFFFSCKDYSLASMLGFYTPSHPNFYLMNFSKEAIHGKTYLIWEKGKKKIGANSIYISDTPGSYKDRLTGFFKKVEHLPPYIIRDTDGRILRIFYIAIGIHYLGGEPDNLSIW